MKFYTLKVEIMKTQFGKKLLGLLVCFSVLCIIIKSDTFVDTDVGSRLTTVSALLMILTALYVFIEEEVKRSVEHLKFYFLNTSIFLIFVLSLAYIYLQLGTN